MLSFIVNNAVPLGLAAITALIFVVQMKPKIESTADTLASHMRQQEAWQKEHERDSMEWRKETERAAKHREEAMNRLAVSMAELATSQTGMQRDMNRMEARLEHFDRRKREED